MVKKITSRFRALGLNSLTGIVLLFERRAFPDAYRVAGWLYLTSLSLRLLCSGLCR